MEIRRTANAGVLITLDGVRILLDGVAGEVFPYSATPSSIREELMACPPDVLAFTHSHADHFDGDFVNQLQNSTHRPVLGPVGLPVPGLITDGLEVGGVRLTALPSRHIGKQADGNAHVSYLIEGSRRILFTGDASPLPWQGTGLPQADVLIATYGFGISESGWKVAKTCDPRVVIFLHLPEKERDTFGLWEAYAGAAGKDFSVPQYTPAMGQKLTLTK